MLDRGPEGSIEQGAETIRARDCLGVHLEEGHLDLLFVKLCVEGVEASQGMRINQTEVKRPGRRGSKTDERDEKVQQDIRFMLMRGENRTITC